MSFQQRKTLGSILRKKKRPFMEVVEIVSSSEETETEMEAFQTMLRKKKKPVVEVVEIDSSSEDIETESKKFQNMLKKEKKPVVEVVEIDSSSEEGETKVQGLSKKSDCSVNYMATKVKPATSSETHKSDETSLDIDTMPFLTDEDFVVQITDGHVEPSPSDDLIKVYIKNQGEEDPEDFQSPRGLMTVSPPPPNLRPIPGLKKILIPPPKKTTSKSMAAGIQGFPITAKKIPSDITPTDDYLFYKHIYKNIPSPSGEMRDREEIIISELLPDNFELKSDKETLPEDSEN